MEKDEETKLNVERQKFQMHKKGYENIVKALDNDKIVDELSGIKDVIKTNPKIGIEINGDSIKTFQGAKGDKGEKGDKGDKGDKGKDGNDGKNGRNGINGIDGKDGKNGKDGKDGINGKDGVNGKDGKDGKDGSPDTGEQIIDKIKNKKKWIKSGALSDDVISEVRQGLGRNSGGGANALKLLTDVDLSGLLQDSKGNYILGSGSSGGEGESMVYPGAGIPLSTGSAWGTSITNNSSNWNTAYGWGNHASAGYLTSSSILDLVTGPATSTDENIVVFNETTGKIIKDSGKKLSDYVEDTFLFDSTAESAKNLCDETFLDRYALSAGTYNIEYANDANSFAVIVPIEAGKTYTVTKYVGGNRFRVGLTSAYPTNPGSLPMATLYHYLGTSDSTQQSHTFTNTYGANYVTVVISYNSTSPAHVQVEEGSSSTDYEPYNPSPDIIKVIKPELINLPENITNVKDFGAVGDGTTDDTASLEEAFAYGFTNKTPIFFPPGTYMIRRSLVLRDYMEVYGKEATLKKFAAVTTTTTAITPEGQEYVVVTDVTGFTVGSQMFINDIAGARFATYGIITSIDVGNKRIYFTSSYDSIKPGAIQDHASGTKVSTSHALIRSWSTYWGCVGAYVHDLTLDGNRQASEANEWTNGCIHIDPVGSTINDITYTYATSDNTFRRLILKNSPFDGISDQSTGGGIVEGCTFINSYKHGVHFGTIYVNGKVYGNTFDSMLGSGVFWCQQAENIVVTDNYFVDCYRGCSSVDFSTPPINSIIANNFFRDITNVVLDFSNTSYSSTYGGMIIESNIVMGLNNNFVRANYLDSILISNNIIRTITTAPAHLIVAQNVNKLIVTNNMSVSNTGYLDSTGATSVVHANNTWN